MHPASGRTRRTGLYADTEDVFQNAFMKYVIRSDVFENNEHEKAWFIRVTINA